MSRSVSPSIDRRSALKLLATGLGAAAIGLPGCASAGLDLSARPDFLNAIARMRGSTDERLVLGWLIGKRYAMVDNKAIPMMGILAGTFTRYRRISEEAFEGRSFEVAYFTDLETGQLAEEWYNPISDQRVEVPQTRMGPSTVILTADGLEIKSASGEATGMEIHHRFLPAVQRMGRVWITEEIMVSGTPSFPGAKPFNYNEMTTYQALQSDLENDKLAAVPTSIEFHSLVSYRPRLCKKWPHFPLLSDLGDHSSFFVLSEPEFAVGTIFLSSLLGLGLVVDTDSHAASKVKTAHSGRLKLFQDLFGTENVDRAPEIVSEHL